MILWETGSSFKPCIMVVPAVIPIKSLRIVLMCTICTVTGCSPQVCNTILSDTVRLFPVILPLFDVINPALPLFMVCMAYTLITCAPVLRYIYKVFSCLFDVFILYLSCQLMASGSDRQSSCRIKLHTITRCIINGPQPALCQIMHHITDHFILRECAGTDLDNRLIQFPTVCVLYALIPAHGFKAGTLCHILKFSGGLCCKRIHKLM